MPTVFFVGRSDDLLYSEYQEVMVGVYGGIPTDPAAFADEDRLDEFMRQARGLRPPKIVGMVIPSSSIRDPQSPGVQELTQGFRFMGQRFIPDSYIFSQLVYAYVGPKPTGSFRRGMPKGLDLLAVMGSERAYEILDQEGETDYIGWIAAAWMPNLSYLDFATGEALAESQAHVQELIDQGFYAGYHLVQLDLRSFDLQDATHAVVTAREIWWDERFQAPAGEMGDLVATRPEYTRDVIYHLERSGERWLVSRVLVQGEAPEWQEKGP